MTDFNSFMPTWVHWFTKGKETMVTPACLAVSRMTFSSASGWAARELVTKASISPIRIHQGPLKS